MKIRDLQVTYQSGGKRFTAVRGQSFDLAEGDALGILGESGAGKSTIGLAMLGLIERPNEVKGQILYREKDVLRMKETELAAYRWKEVSLVFQAAMNALDPVITVGKNFSQLLHDKLVISGSQKVKQQYMEKMLAMVKLPPQVTGMYPFELSGGMKQRVIIAMALCTNPKILIADEPTTALDTITQFSILSLIRQLRINGQIPSSILISHDIAVQSFLSDRLIVMYKRSIVEEGKVNEVLKSAMHPYTRGLIGSLTIAYKKSTNSRPDNSKGKLNVLENSCPYASYCPHAMEKCFEEFPKMVRLGETHKTACFLYGA